MAGRFQAGKRLARRLLRSERGNAVLMVAAALVPLSE